MVIKVWRYLASTVRSGTSFAQSLELLAPFGDWGFCIGRIVSSLGFLVAACAAVVLFVASLGGNTKTSLPSEHA
jgi:hypothetical protein